MRKLVVLFALVLSTTAAWAQAEKPQPVTKLPGEEKLSTRERAERDFLMPVRRKKATDPARPTASAEQLTSAAPETDAIAHYNEAAADPRPEEVAAPAHHAAATGRSRATRHAAWLAARREAHATAARHASKASRTKSSKSTKASRAAKAHAAKHSSRATHHAAKASSHHSTKSASHKVSKASSKKVAHHSTAKKVKIKTKAKHATKHKRR
ncbi:hypothetical protein [Hymenobacter psoromatis]|uniref:hypothetical protein n=1 Tax=Hymenobacter psoromatis TaxID=1484116 RepID=UPI001CBFDF5E|nr:hypothetical protein [Hymenobacter psoromatis]